MKLIKSNLLLTIAFYLLPYTLSQILDLPKYYNQKQVYPNQYEAPTNSTQLSYNNFTSPFLSHALFENDPKRQLKKEEFLRYIRFAVYRMTRGEAEQVFGFADGNSNDLISQEEWDLFSSLYIFPFEACDRDHDYLLNAHEFADCFDKDPKSRFVIFRRRDYPSRHEQMMWAVTTRAKPLLNIYDYIFIRRSLFAWKNCMSNAKFIAKNQFRCAVRTALFQKVHFSVEYDEIYDAIIYNGDKSLIELDFIGYLKAMQATFIFATYGAPMNIPFLEKDNFIKAIREDRLPTNFEESEVQSLYKIINTNPVNPVTEMNFPTFYFFYNLHKLFNKYSIERPLLLRNNELVNLLDDRECPWRVVLAIDQAITNFNTPMYQEASLILNRNRVNEDSFYYSFKSKQDASENTAAIWNSTTVNATYFVTQKNITNRNVFFSIFTNPKNKEYWSKEAFYRAFQLGNLFSRMLPDKFVVPSTIFVENLTTMMTKVNPPVAFTQRENFPIYRAFPREVYIDVLIFLSIENYRVKFESVMKSAISTINESYARLILMDFGMKDMPETVMDIAKTGFDPLRRRTYNVNDLFKNCILVQSVAAENERSRLIIEKFDVKLTGDDSRRFPTFPRRQEATPFV